MSNELARRWEALVGQVGPDRSAREVLFDPQIADWALAGVSQQYQEVMQQHREAEEQRAVLVDRLRWMVQKRLSGRRQEVMLLFLAGCSRERIGELLGCSRTTVYRELQQAGAEISAIVASGDQLGQGWRCGGVTAQLLPLDTPDDWQEFLGLLATVKVQHVALGTYSDLREVLVVYHNEARP